MAETALVKAVHSISEEETQAVGIMIQQAKSIVVSTQEQNLVAVAFHKAIGVEKKRIDTQRKSHTEPLDREKKQIMDSYRPFMETLEQAEKIVKTAIIGYAKEQQRLARDAQAKLDRIAEKAAQDERDRKALQERQWREKEEKLLAEGRVEEAAKAAAKADQRAEEAESVQVQNVLVAPPPKAAGVCFKKTCKARIINEMLIPREHCSPDQRKLDKFAGDTNGTIVVPGVVFYFEDSMSRTRG
ncbi:MAG: hypothetical protein WC623_24030 [Pedobacter sp.]|uniref:hypothetical protein n=1 Tax=Pedobacter sp. TaxID=1411316 RepID=UPI003568DA23